MKFITVNGGNSLRGEVRVDGMKNAALPVIFAAILTNDVCIIENIPNVSDILLSFDILRLLGAKVVYSSTTNTAEIDVRPMNKTYATHDMVSRIRGSTYLIGALLGRFGESHVGLPGGCDFGTRPIDQHLKGFSALGADISYDGGYVNVEAKNGLHGASIYFDMQSVGATVNIMIAAALARGTTVIDNAAREPHIVDLANFLNHCGADITGAGTTTIKINGVEKLHGATYKIVPDMIEAGTYMVAAAAVGGEVRVENVIPKHMETVTSKLLEMGVELEVEDTAITVRSNGGLHGVAVRTLPYPGFPTDMQPQFGALMCFAGGIGTITESVWDNRFKYLSELEKMGAVCDIEKNKAIFSGPCAMKGAEVHATDLRAGAALLIAAMAASGTSRVTGVEYIERGYYDIVGKLRGLGADIQLSEE